MEVRSKSTKDSDAIERFLTRHNARMVARGGELVDALDHPALIAEDDGEITGALTYIPGRAGYEVLTLHTGEPRRGVGTALMMKMEEIARTAGSERLFLTTTNDNVDALRFYQRRGYRLVRVDPGAVDRGRELKPSIPEFGEYGIPLRDELLLEKRLVDD